MSIYSVYDKKALSFSPLFIAENDNVAKRIVVMSMVSNTLLSSSPSDFSLYHIGEFNSDNGDLSGISPINFVCEVLSLVKVDKDKESD